MEKTRTLIPQHRPPFNEWCEMFNVSRSYVRREGINNAQRIMSLWDGFAKTKELFIKKKFKSDEE
jgi:hypothetical protein